MLSSVIPREYSTQDSFSFVKEIQSTRCNDDYLVSYDVISLYTSIPLAETIKLAVDIIIENNINAKITKEELTTLFEFATSKTHFQFDGGIYDQIDGISMGSPVAPSLANLFMGVHEVKWLN